MCGNIGTLLASIYVSGTQLKFNNNLTSDSQYLDSNKLPPKHKLYIIKQS
jgi:hypothetical protein